MKTLKLTFLTVTLIFMATGCPSGGGGDPCASKLGPNGEVTGAYMECRNGSCSNLTKSCD